MDEKLIMRVPSDNLKTNYFRMKIKHLIIVALVACGFWACNKSDIYTQYITLRENGWSKDSLYTFDVPVTDTTFLYNVYINIRNRSEYPYQNLWLFLRNTSPDKKTTRDTIECYLADDYGKWIGSGNGAVYEMPVLYAKNLKFHKAGTYRYQVGHGMRDKILAGINDIGVRVEKVENK